MTAMFAKPINGVKRLWYILRKDEKHFRLRSPQERMIIPVFMLSVYQCKVKASLHVIAKSLNRRKQMENSTENCSGVKL